MDEGRDLLVYLQIYMYKVNSVLVSNKNIKITYFNLFTNLFRKCAKKIHINMYVGYHTLLVTLENKMSSLFFFSNK